MSVPEKIIVPLKNGAEPAPFLTRPRVRRWGILILIVWLALFLRVWQLDMLPPGLHYDEAFNGTVARDVERGINLPIFFVGNFGEEPMHMYAEALLFKLVGESPWAIRLTSALFGVLFVVGVYACARAFFPREDVLALSAAFLAATLYWAINFSRIGIETNSMPPVLALSAAALGFAYRRMTWKWAALAGFLTGAELYTYLASRLWYVVLILWFIYLLIFYRSVVRTNRFKWSVIGGVMLLTMAPLILFFVANPLALAGRAGTVFTPETLGTNLAQTAGMFFVTGDMDPRDNLPGRPALDWILASLFVIGLVIALVRWRKPSYALLLIWVVVMTAPSALTEFAPNFRRAIGALPAIILLCALGFEWLWNIAATRDPTVARLKPGRWAQIVLVLGLGLSAVWSARAYFVDWAGGTGLFYSFDAGILKVAQGLAARPKDEQLCLSPHYDDHFTVIWALDGRAVSSFDGRRVLVLPDSSRAATCGIITYEDGQTLGALDANGVKPQAVSEIADAAGKPYATLVTIPAHSQQQTTALANIGDFAVLASAESRPTQPQAGNEVKVTLSWHVVRPATQAYIVFVHLSGPLNPVINSTVWAQADEQPGGGTYPTTRWKTGETVIETYTLGLPANAPAGKYTIETGMYLLDTGARVPLTKDDGTRVANEAFVIGTFQLK